MGLGTTEGWESLGNGMVDFANLACATCPVGVMMRVQMTNQTVSYIQNIPKMSLYEFGYDFGYGSEKALEVAITRNIYTGAGIGLGKLRLLSNTTLTSTTLFKYGRNFRIDFDFRNFLHYHRRGPGGIGRHRPWQVKSGDKGNFWKRF